jgi:hypothetical protein
MAIVDHIRSEREKESNHSPAKSRIHEIRRRQQSAQGILMARACPPTRIRGRVQSRALIMRGGYGRVGTTWNLRGSFIPAFCNPAWF